MRFDVISEGHGLSNAVRVGAGPSLFKVKATRCGLPGFADASPQGGPDNLVRANRDLIPVKLFAAQAGG
jgi:hypothetical protein